MSTPRPKRSPGLSLPSTPSTPDACPCGTGHSLASCCGRVHADHSTARTPEQLMRARYSAFVLRRRSFLERSWHPSTRPETVDLDDEAEWLGLTVDRHAFEDGDDRGEVTFTARYRDAGVTGGDAVRQLVEHSRFVREDDCWFYLDAVDRVEDSPTSR